MMSVWAALTLLWLLCAPYSAYAQQVLAVSALQSCTSASFGNVQLNCSQTLHTVTILDVRTAYVPSGGSSSRFQFNLSALPASAGITQVGTSTQCTQPTPTTNLCGVSTPATITIEATKPVTRYRLRRATNFQIPFAYWYTLVDADCQDEACKAVRNSTYSGCRFLGATSSKSYGDSINTAPTAQQIAEEFAKRRNKEYTPGVDHMRCQRSGPNSTSYTSPNGIVVDPGTSAMVYTFECTRYEGKNFAGKPLTEPVRVQFFANFYQLAPMCNVYIPDTPEVVGRINITVTDNDTGDSEFLVVDTNEYQTAAVSSDGRIMVRILNQQSATDNIGQPLGGVIMVCGDAVLLPGSYGTAVVPPLDMFGPNGDVLQNPYLRYSSEQVGFTMPTPEQLRLVRDDPTNPPNLFWWFTDATHALNFGRGCGMPGVAPNYYEQGFDTGSDFYYLANFKDRSAGIPYSEIAGGIQSIQTCVPGFGFDYRDMNFTSACQAATYFADANAGGTLAARSAACLAQGNRRLYVPRQYDSIFPNIAFRGEDMYVYAPLDVQWELALYTRGDFVGVTQTVVSGSIDRTGGTGCVINPENFGDVGFVNVRVCSGVVQPPQVAAYIVYVQCAENSGIAVRAPLQQTTAALGFEQCQLITFSLVATALVDFSSAKCTAYVSNSVAVVTFVPGASMILDQVELQCIESSLGPEGSATGPQRVLVEVTTLPNGSIISRQNITFEQPDQGVDTAIIILAIVGVIFLAMLLVGLGTVIWARIKSSNATKYELVNTDPSG